jgi:hypothetical protein
MNEHDEADWDSSLKIAIDAVDFMLDHVAGQSGLTCQEAAEAYALLARKSGKEQVAALFAILAGHDERPACGDFRRGRRPTHLCPARRRASPYGAWAKSPSAANPASTP